MTRRNFLAMIPAAPLLVRHGASPAVLPGTRALTREERDRMTPSQVLDFLKHGNKRFRTGRTLYRNYRDQQRATAGGQYPAAIVLGCIDSRTPAEILFDAGIGDMFSARIAGNVVNDELLGSMEFACAVAGAKAIVVLGHTACGAIKGAIDDVVLGNLTGLLARIKPAIAETTFSGEKQSGNAAYIDAVARTNVRLGIETIRRRSPALADLEKTGRIVIAGAMYDLATGVVQFSEEAQ
jgi:carbonic anhydrase